ncbi:MAG: hypothetical protein ABSF14_22935 [Terriglobia bacterium]|jgi:hypothetical protein
MKKSKKAKREREPLYTRIHNDLIDLNLPPLLHMTLERLHRWADRETGIVKMCSGHWMETTCDHQWGYDAYKDALLILEKAGYIVRLMTPGSHSTFRIKISNYWAVRDGKSIGMINRHEILPLDGVLALMPPKKSRAKSSLSTKPESSGGITPPETPPESPLETPPETPLKDSRSSMSSLGSEIEVGHDKQLKAVSAVPPAAVMTASPLRTKKAESADGLPGETKPVVLPKAEVLARNWWVIQGKRKDQIESIPTWATRFQGLLDTYPDLEPALVYWWNQDPWWGKGKGNTHPMLRYESDGDSLDWFESKLDVPEDQFKSLWWLFRRYEKRLKKNKKPLPLFPVELPVVPTPVPVAKAKALSTPPTPPAPPVAPPRTSDDTNEVIDDLPEWSRGPVRVPTLADQRDIRQVRDFWWERETLADGSVRWWWLTGNASHSPLNEAKPEHIAYFGLE